MKNITKKLLLKKRNFKFIFNESKTISIFCIIIIKSRKENYIFNFSFFYKLIIFLTNNKKSQAMNIFKKIASRVINFEIIKDEYKGQLIFH